MGVVNKAVARLGARRARAATRHLERLQDAHAACPTAANERRDRQRANVARSALRAHILVVARSAATRRDVSSTRRGDAAPAASYGATCPAKICARVPVPSQGHDRSREGDQGAGQSGCDQQRWFVELLKKNEMRKFENDIIYTHI